MTTLAPSLLNGSFSFVGNKDFHNGTYNGRNFATALVLSILNGSSSFLHTIRTTILAWMSLNLVKIPSRFYFGVSSP